MYGHLRPSDVTTAHAVEQLTREIEGHGHDRLLFIASLI